MKLVVGLGNPGEKYQNNRHNVGFMFVDYLINELTGLRVNEFKYNKYLLSEIYHLSTLPSTTHPLPPNILLAKPQTFMNKSGDAVKKLTITYSLLPNDLIVVHDDLDIPLGMFKIHYEGPKLHNGIESIEKTLRTKKFLRIRVGVDNRKPESRINGESYVLQDFSKEEKTIVDQVFAKILNTSAYFKK